jgi:hypothetical protein
MSLYIGNDTVSDTILHVTSDAQDLSVMKGDPISTTLFHSKSELLSAKVYEATNIQYSDFWYCEFPSAFITEILSHPDSLAFQILVNDAPIPINNWGSSTYIYMPMIWSPAYSIATVDAQITPGYNIGVIGNGVYSSITSAKIIVYNFTVHGEIIGNTHSGEVFIDSNTFTVGGTDLSSILYLSNKINNDDTTFFSADGTELQLINSATGFSGYTLSANRDEFGNSDFVIYNGTKKILDTSSTLFVCQKGTPFVKHYTDSEMWFSIGSQRIYDIYTIPSNIQMLIVNVNFDGSHNSYSFILNKADITVPWMSFVGYYVGYGYIQVRVQIEIIGDLLRVKNVNSAYIGEVAQYLRAHTWTITGFSSY